MKHTMKKLLCMALAIMLLISVVPVFAMAEGLTGGEQGEMQAFDIEYYYRENNTEHGVDTGLPGSVTVRVLSNAPDASVVRSEALKIVSADIAKTIIANKAGVDVAGKTLGNVEVTVATREDGTNFVKYVLPVADSPTTDISTTQIEAVILEKVGSSYVDQSKRIPVDVVITTTSNPTTRTVAVSKWKTGAEIKERFAAPFEGKTVYVDRTYVDQNVPYICISTSTSSSSSNENSIAGNGGSSNGGSNNNGGSGSNNSGSSNTNNGTSQNLGNGGTGIVNGSNTDRNRFPYDVVLHIYQNNKVDEPVKNIVINDSLAADGTVSLSEVKTEVMKHFSAKTSAGIGYAGLYYARGNWVKDYATYNGEYDAITGIDSMRQVSQVDINVMITNATAKTTSTAKADSSNPKTGDTIFVPVMVMGLTATALAAAYVFGKKRIAR